MEMKYFTCDSDVYDNIALLSSYIWQNLATFRNAVDFPFVQF